MGVEENIIKHMRCYFPSVYIFYSSLPLKDKKNFRDLFNDKLKIFKEEYLKNIYKENNKAESKRILNKIKKNKELYYFYKTLDRNNKVLFRDYFKKNISEKCDNNFKFYIYGISKKDNPEHIIYIGQHIYYDILDYYMGSGSKLKEEYKKYGKKEFVKKILEENISAFDIGEKERFYIKKYRDLGQAELNISNGGGTPVVFRKYNDSKSYEEYKEKLKVKRKEYLKQWIEKNYEHKKQTDKEYYEKNKEKIKLKNREYKLKKRSIMKKSIEEEFLSEVIPDKQRSTRRKSINSKRKGKSAERDCAHILNEHFGKEIWFRNIQSGAFVGGTNRGRADGMSKELQESMTSDIVLKDASYGTYFSIEHKAYNEASFWDMFNEASDLHRFMNQALTDANSIDKYPLLIIKYNKKKRIVWTTKKADVEHIFVHRWLNKDWYCYWLDTLFEMPNDYFFRNWH